MEGLTGKFPPSPLAATAGKPAGKPRCQDLWRRSRSLPEPRAACATPTGIRRTRSNRCPTSPPGALRDRPAAASIRQSPGAAPRRALPGRSRRARWPIAASPLFRNALETVPNPFLATHQTTDTRQALQSRTAESPGRTQYRGRFASGYNSSPRPSPSAVPPRRKNGTSEPSLDASAWTCSSLHAQLPQPAQSDERCRGIAAAAAEARHHRNLSFAA